MMFIYNFKTKKHELLAKDMKDMTAEEFEPYIPQEWENPAYLGLFRCYVEMGETPINAYIKTLEDGTKKVI